MLLALDAYHLTAGVTAGMDRGRAEAALDEMLERIRGSLAAGARRRSAARSSSRPPCRCTCRCWATTNTACRARARASSTRLNAATAAMAEEEGVDILAVDDRAAPDGMRPGTIPALWHRAKQEVAPPAGADLRRPRRPLARGQAGPVVQVPGARPGQHALGRRHRR